MVFLLFITLWHKICLFISEGNKERRENMSRVIFASHGELSKGMKNSVSMIVGDLSNKVETYSLLPGQNPEDYYQLLKKEIEVSKEQVIILCDIQGGSVHTALSKLAVFDNVIVFSGMNMGLALDIVLKTATKDIDSQEAMNLLNTSKEGITVMNGLYNKEDEDF